MRCLVKKSHWLHILYKKAVDLPSLLLGFLQASMSSLLPVMLSEFMPSQVAVPAMTINKVCGSGLKAETRARERCESRSGVNGDQRVIVSQGIVLKQNAHLCFRVATHFSVTPSAGTCGGSRQALAFDSLHVFLCGA